MIWSSKQGITRQSGFSPRQNGALSAVADKSRQRGAFGGAAIKVKNWETRKAGGLQALPRGNVLFECLGELRMNELKRKPLVEVAHHPRLDPAKRHERTHRRPVFRGDRCARQRQVHDAAG